MERTNTFNMETPEELLENFDPRVSSGGAREVLAQLDPKEEKPFKPIFDDDDNLLLPVNEATYSVLQDVLLLIDLEESKKQYADTPWVDWRDDVKKAYQTILPTVGKLSEHFEKRTSEDLVFAQLQYLFAEFSMYHRGMYKELESIRRKYPKECFKALKSTKYMNNPTMFSHTFDKEVQIKKVIGVLEAGEQNEEIREAIKRAMRRCFKASCEYHEKPGRKTSKRKSDELAELLRKLGNINDFDLYCAADVMFYHYFANPCLSDPADLWEAGMILYTEEHLGVVERSYAKNFLEYTFPEGSRFAVLDDYDRLVMEHLGGKAEFFELSAFEIMLQKAEEEDLIKRVDFLTKHSRAIAREAYGGNVYEDYDVGFSQWDYRYRNLILAAGFDPRHLLAEGKLTKEEKEVLKKSAYEPMDKDELDEDDSPKYIFDALTYFQNLIFYLVLKKFRQTKEMVNASHFEERDLELEVAQDENLELQAMVAKKEEEIRALQQENQRLQKALNAKAKQEQKEARVIEVPLKKQISQLEEELRVSKEKDTELAKLRTVLFQMTQGKDLPEIESSFDLNKFLEKHTVAIAGGHPILMNKLASKFPKLKLIDGTVATQNLNSLQSVDYLFVNTDLVH